MAKSTQTIRSFSIIIKTANQFKETLEIIEEFAISFTSKLGLNIVKEVSHQFSPQGITYCAILSESNLSIHTWPEFNTIHLDLVSCKLIEEIAIRAFLIEYFGENTYIRMESINDFDLN